MDGGGALAAPLRLASRAARSGLLPDVLPAGVPSRLARSWLPAPLPPSRVLSAEMVPAPPPAALASSADRDSDVPVAPPASREVRSWLEPLVLPPSSEARSWLEPLALLPPSSEARPMPLELGPESMMESISVAASASRAAIDSGLKEALSPLAPALPPAEAVVAEDPEPRVEPAPVAA